MLYGGAVFFFFSSHLFLPSSIVVYRRGERYDSTFDYKINKIFFLIYLHKKHVFERNMHANKLAREGIRYLGDLQLNELCQLQEELDVLWNSGQAKVSNSLYDKVVDSINYQLSQLTNAIRTIMLLKKLILI